MPESVSLSKIPPSAKQFKVHLGAHVPWEVKTYFEDTVALETVGGIFDLTSWATISIEGPDAIDYLQRMTTVNFKTLAPQSVTYGAFLTGKGTVVSLGQFLREENRVVYMTTELQRQTALDHIEKFHFAEQFETKDISPTEAIFGWWNPRDEFLSELNLKRDTPVGKIEWRRWKSIDLEIWRDSVRPELFFFGLDRKAAERFLFEMERLKVPQIGYRVFENLRLKRGIPEVGAELTEKEIILESGFEVAVHRNKGCYPGQEVVERIFTYGSVNRKLLPVEVKLKAAQELTLPLDLSLEGAKVGQLVSVSQDARDATHAWGLAYLHKGLWDKDQIFKLPEGEVFYRRIA